MVLAWYCAVEGVIVFDSVGYIDTLEYIDTTVFVDTAYDTLTVLDTLYDTVAVPDTVWHHDTTHVVVRDTTIDTIYHYNTDPFIHWITLPDSLPFHTFSSGSTHTVGWRITGLDPALVQSYYYKPAGGTVWNTPTIPLLQTFSGPDKHTYYLRAVTDSGEFVNPWTVASDPASLTAAPELYRIFLYGVACGSPAGLDVSALAPCTLYTSGAADFCYGYSVQWKHVAGKTYEHLFSISGDYSTGQPPTGETDSETLAGEEICPGPVSDGRHLFANYTARYVAPDTSAWAPWVTLCAIVDFDPCP